MIEMKLRPCFYTHRLPLWHPRHARLPAGVLGPPCQAALLAPLRHHLTGCHVGTPPAPPDRLPCWHPSGTPFRHPVQAGRHTAPHLGASYFDLQARIRTRALLRKPFFPSQV
jgi:hypothetical protein